MMYVMILTFVVSFLAVVNVVHGLLIWSLMRDVDRLKEETGSYLDHERELEQHRYDVE